MTTVSIHKGDFGSVIVGGRVTKERPPDSSFERYSSFIKCGYKLPSSGREEVQQLARKRERKQWVKGGKKKDASVGVADPFLLVDSWIPWGTTRPLPLKGVAGL